MSETPFPGFPGISRATTIPDAFFSEVLPRMRGPEELLAFLWAARVIQAQRGDVRCATAADIWESEGAADALEALAGGRPGLERGLGRCAELGALVGLDLDGGASVERLYFLNNPGSQRAIFRIRSGEAAPPHGMTVRATPVERERPGIFRLYEENIGTITPLVGERLIEAAAEYPPAWLEDAFREAAELNRRSWRYIERMLQTWAQEGRGNETVGRDTFEERRRRYLG